MKVDILVHEHSLCRAAHRQRINKQLFNSFVLGMECVECGMSLLGHVPFLPCLASCSFTNTFLTCYKCLFSVAILLGSHRPAIYAIPLLLGLEVMS